MFVNLHCVQVYIPLVLPDICFKLAFLLPGSGSPASAAATAAADPNPAVRGKIFRPAVDIDDVGDIVSNGGRVPGGIQKIHGQLDDLFIYRSIKRQDIHDDHIMQPHGFVSVSKSFQIRSRPGDADLWI